jgi:K+-sensing histidine kinase KdpD
MQEVLVLVFPRSDPKQMILAGEDVAQREGKPLRVVNIQPRKGSRQEMNASLERLFVLARGARAELAVFYSDNAAATAISVLSRNKADRVIVSVPRTVAESETIGGIRAACPDLPLQMVDERGVLSGYPAMIELAKTAMAL